MGDLPNKAGAEVLREDGTVTLVDDKPAKATTVALAKDKLVKANMAFLKSQRWVQDRDQWAAVGSNGKIMRKADVCEELRQLWPEPPPQTFPSTIVLDASFRADAEKSPELRSFMNSVDEHARRYGLSEEALERARRNEARLEAFKQTASKRERES